ncbi:GGDEF domain-containing protein [Modestobacter excelsi]|uniref:GGDEF domain-containing protein n=1 Tax=Modestobacter excelsi TaxID=2213161 RepID=UPI00110CA9BA|nr:GGDEF domain-containing protein [Modestobacter excelsi]
MSIPDDPADLPGDMDTETTGSRLPPHVGLLALLHGAGGLLCAVGALRPMSPDTPVGLAWVLAAVGLTVAALLATAGDRLPAVAQHTALALFSLLLALLAARSATPQGVVGLGPVLICTGLYAAHFLSLRAARAQVLLAVVTATLGALAARPTGFLLPWTIAVLAALVLTEAHARLNGRLRTQASVDPLTGVANRRAWEAEATRGLARAARTGEPLTVAILDLDGFKAVNDRDGHGAGDRLLRQVATAWRTRLRTSDLLGRYGGDEFVLCLPGTDARTAADVLQRLDGGLPVGWSVGTATAHRGDSLTELLRRADVRLYEGKRARRET